MDAVFAYEYTPSARILVTDEDAADFLQSQFSNELRPFAPGQCSYGLWLDVKGKVVADSWILCEGAERFRIFSEHSPAQVIVGKLQQHIIADDVELEELVPLPAVSLTGAGVAEVLRQLIGQVPEVGRFVSADGRLAVAGRRTLAPSYEVFFESVAASDDFRSDLKAAGVEFVDKVWMQQQRLAAGIPEVPTEIGSQDLPGEGGFEVDAISFNKGCFLGQEVVARMHHVGQARRALYIVQGVGACPSCPMLLTDDAGKTMGELRSAIADSQGWLGVALLKTLHVELDQQLIYSGGNARVIRFLRR